MNSTAPHLGLCAESPVFMRVRASRPLSSPQHLTKFKGRRNRYIKRLRGVASCSYSLLAWGRTCGWGAKILVELMLNRVKMEGFMIGGAWTRECNPTIACTGRLIL